MSNYSRLPKQPWFWRFWTWPRRKPDIELTSPLAIDDCRKRLRETISYKWGLRGLSTSHHFIGQVWETGFYFTNHRRSLFQQSGQLFVCGNFIGLSHGTGIEATFRFNPVWLPGFLVPMLGFIGLTIEDAILARDSPWVWLLMGVFVGVYAAIDWYRIWSNKSLQAEMIAYLCQLLGTIE